MFFTFSFLIFALCFLFQYVFFLPLPAIDALIPHLANVNVTDRAGRTSLHHAAFNGHVEVCTGNTVCVVHSYMCYTSVLWDTLCCL